MTKSNIKIDTWYDLYDKEHIIPDPIPNETTLMLLLENDEIVKDDSDWDDKYPLTLVTHWKLVVKE